MKDFKIEVKNQEESKEAQELFFELGATLGNGDRHAVLVPNIMGLAVIDGLINFVFNDVVFIDIKQCKEITLPHLRDKVVLHRNDVRDATDECRTDSEFKYRLINNTWHVITGCNPFWRKDSISRDEAPLFIKPIKKDGDMENLISGKEALIALANGKKVLIRNHHWDNFDDLTQDFSLSVFFLGGYEFKLKPRTIKIGDVDVPAPFEPKIGDEFYFVSADFGGGYSWIRMHDDTPEHLTGLGAWRTEEEIKQVVAALRKLMGVAK